MGLLMGLGSRRREVSGPWRRPGRAEAEADENRASSSTAPHHTPATEAEARWHELLEASRPDPPEAQKERPSEAERGLGGTPAGNDSGNPRCTGVGGRPSPGSVSGGRGPGPRQLMLRTGPGDRAERSTPSQWPPQPQAQAGAGSASTATPVPSRAAVAAAWYGRHSIWGNKLSAGQRFLARWWGSVHPVSGGDFLPPHSLCDVESLT